MGNKFVKKSLSFSSLLRTQHNSKDEVEKELMEGKREEKKGKQGGRR